jgi:hypothetical protein
LVRGPSHGLDGQTRILQRAGGCSLPSVYRLLQVVYRLPQGTVRLWGQYQPIRHKERVTTNPKIMAGKPVILETHSTVEGIFNKEWARTKGTNYHFPYGCIASRMHPTVINSRYLI